MKPHNDWAAADELPPRNAPVDDITADSERRMSSPVLLATAKPRTGPTKLGPGKTARHHLDGETAAGFYHNQQSSTDNMATGSSLTLDQPYQPVRDRRISSAKGEKSRLSISSSSVVPPVARPESPATSPRRPSTYNKTERRISTTPSFIPTRAAERRNSPFQAGGVGGGTSSWVG